MMRLGSIFAGLVVATLPSLPQTTVYVDAALDGTNVVATAITDTHYAMAGQHTAYANLTLRSPSGRLSTVTMFHANIATASTSLPVNNDYGDWSASNHGQEYCPIGNVTCHQPAPGYDQSPTPRRFEFIGFWGYLVFLVYCMRRVNCRQCGVLVEEVPWGVSGHQKT